MARQSCRLGRLLVLLAFVALAAIALAPRGMLHVTAASQVEQRAVDVDPSPSYSATVDDTSALPGIRNLVAREEQDASDVTLRVLLAVVPDQEGPAGDDRPHHGEPPSEDAQAPAAPRSLPWGERAPPVSI